MKELDEYLPPSRRERAASLVRYINKGDIISWNKNRSLIYKDKKVPKSNIRELISHAVLDSAKKVKGIKEFYKGLSELGIPKIFIANNEGRQLMKKYRKKKEPKFRPPGKLKNML